MVKHCPLYDSRVSPVRAAAQVKEAAKVKVSYSVISAASLVTWVAQGGGYWVLSELT